MTTHREFPKGRLNGDDDGVTEIAIASDIENKRVIFRFLKPMDWIGFDFESGFQVLTNFAKHLSRISGKVISVQIENDHE
ncbi:MAG: hypothetical protein ACRC62_31520 [Microcoleus sp.]